MLPGNHKNELLLIHFVPTLPHHFCCPVFILIYLLFICLPSLSILNFHPPHGSFSNRLRQVHCSLWPEIYYFLSQAPKLKGLHYPGKVGQCTTAHFPGAYLGINFAFGSLDDRIVFDLGIAVIFSFQSCLLDVKKNSARF